MKIKIIDKPWLSPDFFPFLVFGFLLIGVVLFIKIWKNPAGSIINYSSVKKTDSTHTKLIDWTNQAKQLIFQQKKKQQ